MKLQKKLESGLRNLQKKLMVNVKKYKIFTLIFFLSLFTVKFLNIFQQRIELITYFIWILPLLIFYYFLNKLIIRTYQWFCFILLIYFLFASIRVFGTAFFWIDALELLIISILFVHVMFGPKIINRSNQNTSNWYINDVFSNSYLRSFKWIKYNQFGQKQINF